MKLNGIYQALHKYILSKALLIALFSIQSVLSQAQTKEKLFTKSCDTVSVDSMICIKCTNPGLTIGCKRYACDFKNHCIPLPALPPKNKSKDIKTTLPGGNQKRG